MTCPGGAEGVAGGAGGAGGAGAGGGGRLGDIIDLDRYMRAAVRRSASDTTDDGRNERLVVDCGGVKASAGGAALSSSSAGCAARAHHKRYSHDSGLSDGSYAPRVRRPHRRSSAAEGAGGRGGAAQGSSNSLREFRAACERALLDQQQQLARVTQLCERLTAPPAAPRPAPRPAARPAPRPATRPAHDSSELSSSSCSTKDQRRKDKHRADECKTYKIIMNKLDELNRLFAARGRAPPAAAPPRRRTPSSCSVSVSDKLIATEPAGKCNAKLLTQTVQSGKRGERAGGCAADGGLAASAVGVGGAGGGECSARGSRERRVVRAVTHAYALDIAPAASRRYRPNVTTESIVERGSTYDEYASSACDPRCGFDLDDPVHLYAQAKRLQALHASTRRSKSAGYEASRGSKLDKRLGERFGERLDKRVGSRESSLCALCRGYWRAVRRYIGAQLTGPNA